MIVQEMFGSGHAVLWLMLIVGLFSYGRSEIGLIASGRNGVQMETMLGKTYSIFVIQVAVALSLLIFPVVQIFLGIHWFFIISSTVITISLGLATMVILKDIVTKAVKHMEDRKKGEVNDHEGSKVYKHYKILSWVWLVVGIVFLGFIWFSVGRMEFSLLIDIVVWFAMIGYFVAFWSSTITTMETLGKEEGRNREQLESDRKTRKNGKKGKQ